MSISSLGLTCPDGGQFYVCQGNTTQFLGCCAIDPCADGTGSCPQTSLRNTSYTSEDYEDIPAQACVTTSSSSASQSALWYTCADTTPPFLGCCAGENPCVAGGCGGSNGTLVAARLSDNTTDASPFMTSTSDAMTGTTGSNMAMLSTGATIGIAVGSAFGALALGIILFFVYKRRERKKQADQQQHGSGGPDGAPAIYNMGTSYQGKKRLYLCYRLRHRMIHKSGLEQYSLTSLQTLLASPVLLSHITADTPTAQMTRSQVCRVHQARLQCHHHHFINAPRPWRPRTYHPLPQLSPIAHYRIIRLLCRRRRV